MSALKLFNTLTRRKETFVPLDPRRVRIYSCGPTVYHYIHIGNLRTFLWGDLLRRYLRWKGYNVVQVMNITDIDDKIIKSSMAKNVPIQEYTAEYTKAFLEDIAELRILPADHYPKATEHIPEMIDLVGELTGRGHTYVSEGSTYFKIDTFRQYGALSQIDLAAAGGGPRVESDEYDKENARDFVLWKAKKPGETSWKTPMGEGRPGWHLECSAMAMKYLGETFDIHTGAVDLIFPHHENEIAQSEGATGKQFVKYWIHGEHLLVEAQKMAKSAGNFFTLRDLTAQGYSPLQIRHALLAVPHRTKLNFKMSSLDDAKNALERLDGFLSRLGEIAGPEKAGGEPGEPAAGIIRIFLEGFESSMDDDLNTAGALGALFTLIRESNTAIDQGKISAVDAREILSAISRVDEVLDILPRDTAALDKEIEELIAARSEARKRRDFPESDRLRDLLVSKGIILEDTAGATRWRRK